MKIDRREALRYLGIREPDEEALARAEETAGELEHRLRPRYLYRALALEIRPEGVYFPAAGLLLPGRLARDMLADCGQAVLLACTLGAEFDRLLKNAQARGMARAVLLDACGSAYVEAGCDEAEKEIAARHPGLYLTDRFSPGYGDLPLETQPALLRALDAEKRLGVYATESCLINPMKTVTAAIGLSARPQAAKIRGCAVCGLRETCAYRKRGVTCVSSV